MTYTLTYASETAKARITKTFEGRDAWYFVRKTLIEDNADAYIKLTATKVITYGFGDYRPEEVVISTWAPEARFMTEREAEKEYEYRR